MVQASTANRLLGLGAVIALVVFVGAFPAAANPGGTGLVISQVYGGGGNSGAPLTHDFVEIFNPTSEPRSLKDMSVQYASSTGTGHFGATAAQITELPDVTLSPGQYFLVQESSTAAVGSPLPTPDLIDPTPILMSGTAGKVALASTPTSLGCNGGSTICNATQLGQIVDLVGYGGANFFEGAGAAPALSNTTAALRGTSGCTDTDVNSADFAAGSPAPRNTVTPLDPCVAPPGTSLSITDVTNNEGNAGTTSFDFTVSLSAPAPVGGVTFDIATADNTAGSPSDFTATTLTSQTIPAGSSSYPFSVTVNGDTDIEPNESFFVNVTNVNGTGVSVTDGQGQGTITNDDAESCATSATPIHDVQGAGSASPLAGSSVAIKGVVVGDYQSTVTGLGGYYVQEEDSDADANPLTSEGSSSSWAHSDRRSPSETSSASAARCSSSRASPS